jgi:hypothetical protein
MTNKVLYLEEIEISAPLSVVPAGTRIEMSRPKEVIDIGHKPMTDTAKPQKYSKVMPIEVEHEAEDVWQSTGFTPRQLLEQRDELLKAARSLCTELLWRGTEPNDGDCRAWDAMQDILAKCGKVGE